MNILTSATFFLLTSASTLFRQPEQVLKARSAPIHTPPAIVYGFVPYWMLSTPTLSKVPTHLSFFSLRITQDGTIVPDAVVSQDTALYLDTMLEKMRNKSDRSQKTEATLTMMDQDDIPVFFSSPSALLRYQENLQALLQTVSLDGMNIDVEYSGVVDDSLSNTYISFLKNTRDILRRANPSAHFSLSAYADAGSVRRITDLAQAAPFVDHIIMMSYDYHTNGAPRAGPNSPLFGKKEYGFESDIMSDLKAYTDLVPAKKILLGIPLYGRQWEVTNHESAFAFTIPKTGESVLLKHIEPLTKKRGFLRFFDPVSLTPYVFFLKGSTPYTIHYEDAQSVGFKLDLVRQAGLGGVAFWALGYEPESFLLKTI